MRYGSINVDVLVDQTLTSVGMNEAMDEITFTTVDGKTYKMLHDQDCCESVKVEDICGDLQDLVGEPIRQAEESTNSKKHPDGHKFQYEPESFTWTFYRFATIKGSVVIRWLGESNGFYSESVDFQEI